jgi:TonB-dependent SusC/RagA subfamily outer membrane receptor
MRNRDMGFSGYRVFTLATLALLLGVSSVFAQAGRVEGVVRDAQTRDPVKNAWVSVNGTTLSAVTDANGYYLIENIPVGTYDVRAQAIGFQWFVFANLSVTADLPATVAFQLKASILRIGRTVVAGVAEETQGVKLPFAVDQVRGDEIPVPPRSAVAAIRGKVAGVKVVPNSGLPGAGNSVLLRGAKSIDGSNEPLYVVDGVILGASIVDVDALDIQDIEVVKGAPAAALYGDRAANGVISIQTRRGNEIPAGETALVFRSEFGRNNIEHYMGRHESGSNDEGSALTCPAVPSRPP